MRLMKPSGASQKVVVILVAVVQACVSVSRPHYSSSARQRPKSPNPRGPPIPLKPNIFAYTFLPSLLLLALPRSNKTVAIRSSLAARIAEPAAVQLQHRMKLEGHHVRARWELPRRHELGHI